MEDFDDIIFEKAGRIKLLLSDCDGVLTDGAWTVGNVGVPSTTVAGKVHDSGSQVPPSSGGYMIFMDSGGGAATASAMILATVK